MANNILIAADGEEARWYKVSAGEAYAEAQRRIGLAKQQQASMLFLGDLPLEELPPELGELSELCVLALGKQRPAADGQSWDFDYRRAAFRGTDLSPLQHLTSLTSLHLSWCGWVSDVSPLQHLTALTSLNFFGCKQISDLRPVLQLLELRKLGLGRLSAQSFEQIRPLLSQLEDLQLYGTPFDDLDEELTGRRIENVLFKVRAHFADLAAGEATETELKVFVLGNGRIGKTQLVRQLFGEKYDESVPSTHGIQCRQQVQEQLNRWERVRFNFWDFGGQDIYHGSHALFLQGQAVFLLLWTPDTESGTWEEAGTTMRNQPLSYWLDYIHTLIGPQTPVLVVQSQCDDRSLESPAPLPAEHGFEYLREVPFSAKHGLGLEELKGQLRSAADEVLRRYQKRRIGKGRAAVRQRLRSLLEADQQIPADQRQHRTLTQADFERMCRDIEAAGEGHVSSPAALLDYLHQSGVVYYQPKLFGGQIILDQEWALEAIYTLFHREEVYPHLKKYEGKLTRPLLHDLIWGKAVAGKGP
ncbi:MAG: hypothetical protein KDA66_00090, partial [Planctomycetaceae bacterium]|nr:hypothetical protein [Planctomycetaceae bacterium]